MSTISIPISDEDLTFLRRFTGQQGITVEDFMAQHAKNLRLNLEATLHRDIIAATGTFQTGADPQADYYEHQDVSTGDRHLPVLSFYTPHVGFPK